MRSTRTVEGGAAPSGSRRASIPAAVAVALLLVLLPDAEGRTRCSYAGPPTNLLTVTADRNARAEIKRAGQEIRVRESSQRRQACSGGVPTVLNTDTVTVRVHGVLSSAELLLAGGPFSPGVTPEAEGAPEIEVEFSGSDPFGEVVGTPAADEFHWGRDPGGGTPGLNLNPSAGDRDVDVTAGSREPFEGFVVANGAGGNDRILPRPGAALAEEVIADGGRGDDLLIAPRSSGGDLRGGPGDDVLNGGGSFAELDGGAGSDLIIGGRGRDLISGGPGRDVLVGGRGADLLRDRDSMRDRMRCGPGRDVASADRFDRLRDCELVLRPDMRVVRQPSKSAAGAPRSPPRQEEAAPLAGFRAPVKRFVPQRRPAPSRFGSRKRQEASMARTSCSV
jgi:RTX calcium-binding nonapeptide repeat (4 copies)